MVDEQHDDLVLVVDLQRLAKRILVDIQHDRRRTNRRVRNTAPHSVFDERAQEPVSASECGDFVHVNVVLGFRERFKKGCPAVHVALLTALEGDQNDV